LTSRGRDRIKRRNDRPSGVPSDLTPKLASVVDRERFCVWARAEMVSRHSNTRAGVMGGFICKSGYEYRFGADDQTVARECDPNRICDVPFGRLETCLRTSFLDGPDRICASGPAAECEGLFKCLPYLSMWRFYPPEGSSGDQ
jgi:hypothetical protein